MDTQPIIDQPTYTALEESMGADFMPELIKTYEEESPQLIAQLKKSLAEKDCEGFRRAAHSIKSTSNSFGALALGSLARELEMMGRAGDLEGAAQKVETLISAYEGVRQTLEGLCHG